MDGVNCCAANGAPRQLSGVHLSLLLHKQECRMKETRYTAYSGTVSMSSRVVSEHVVLLWTRSVPHDLQPLWPGVKPWVHWDPPGLYMCTVYMTVRVKCYYMCFSCKPKPDKGNIVISAGTSVNPRGRGLLEMNILINSRWDACGGNETLVREIWIPLSANTHAA